MRTADLSTPIVPHDEVIAQLRRELEIARIERDQHRGDLITAKAGLAGVHRECERLRGELSQARELVSRVEGHNAACRAGVEFQRNALAADTGDGVRRRSDLPYKLNQIARWLLDRGEHAMSDVVMAAGAVIDEAKRDGTDTRELACPCPPRHYSPDELGHDLGELERQITREGVGRG